MEEPPLQGFLCPITCEVMDHPAITADGHTYERAAIQEWLLSNNKSPLTNAPLSDTRLVPNIALRHAIEEWRAQQPMAIDPDRLRLSDELLGEGSFGRVLAGRHGHVYANGEGLHPRLPFLFGQYGAQSWAS